MSASELRHPGLSSHPSQRPVVSNGYFDGCDVLMHAMISFKPGPANSVSDADTYSCIHTAHHNTKHQSQAHSHHSRHDRPDAAIVHHIFLDYLLRRGHLYLSVLLLRFAFICWLRCRRLLRRRVSGRNRTGRARGSTVIWLRHYADKQCSLIGARRLGDKTLLHNVV